MLCIVRQGKDEFSHSLIYPVHEPLFDYANKINSLAHAKRISFHTSPMIQQGKMQYSTLPLYSTNIPPMINPLRGYIASKILRLTKNTDAGQQGSLDLRGGIISIF